MLRMVKAQAGAQRAAQLAETGGREGCEGLT